MQLNLNKFAFNFNEINPVIIKETQVHMPRSGYRFVAQPPKQNRHAPLGG